MIAVLGGGVAGAALAWGLTRRGRRDVVVFDPRPPLKGSTGAALGGFRTQHGSELNITLSLRSRPWFEARAGRVRFQPHGYLYLAEDEAVAAELDRRASLQRACGLPIEHPDPASLVPFVDASGVRRTNFCRLDGLYLPPLVLGAFREEAAAAGAEFRYETVVPATELEAADSVAICAGTWSSEVAASLGARLGVEALERAVWEVGPFDWLAGTRVPMVLEAGSGYHFRERDRSLLVMAPGDQHDVGHVREWLRHRVPTAAEGAARCRHGSYEVTFDHHPLVGATERPGVWASCGFSGHGVMHSPAIGDALAAMMLGETPPVDLSPLSPQRTEPLRDLTQL